MVSDYTEYDTLNAVRIVNACLKAGKPQMITAALLDHRAAASVEAELAAEATAATQASPTPDRTAARAPAATNDALAVAIEKRFRTQNRRPGT